MSHTNQASGLASTSKLSSMGFLPVGSTVDTQARRAEVKMTVVLAQHNLPLAIMDHLSPLFRDIFPDSNIAKSFSAARTKSTCNMNMALMQFLQEIAVISVLHSSH